MPEVAGCATSGWVAVDSVYEGGGCEGGGDGCLGPWSLAMEGSIMIAIGLAEVRGVRFPRSGIGNNRISLPIHQEAPMFQPPRR